RTTERQIQHYAVAVGAIDLLEEVGELAGHPRVDFDYAQRVSINIIHEFHVELAIVEPHLAHYSVRHVQHARLDILGQLRRILEAAKRDRTGEHDRINDSHCARLALIHVTVQRRLQSRQQLFSKQTPGANLVFRIAAQEGVEGLKKRICSSPPFLNSRELRNR